MIFSPGEVKEIDVEFPSPLGVLGLTTTRISAKPVSAIQFPSPLGVLGLTTSRTICSSPGSMQFPSPLGVLGLTTYPREEITNPASKSFRPLSGFWV
ncbi:Uncharacterised protein [Mycobacterium tuberculosis]|nr:Uncharacterised protein [Mycobacterium tuberculosis]